MFFGAAEAAPMTRLEVKQGRAVCVGCPVRRDCLASALGDDESFGIWGGYTAPERQRAMELLRGIHDVLRAFDQGRLDSLVRKL